MDKSSRHKVWKNALNSEKYLQPIDGMMPSERVICKIEKMINS